MLFYDMITNFGEEIIKDLPYEIREKTEKLDLDVSLYLNRDDHNSLLNDVWEIAYGICKEYIEMENFINIGIEKNILLEDIKEHIIFTIFASFKFEKIGKKSLRKLCGEIKGMSSKEMNGTSIYTDFYDKWIEMYIFLIDGGIRYSDYYDYLNQIFKEKETKGYQIDFYDSKFLGILVDKWKLCPYNNEYLFGITFEKLSKFGKGFVDSSKELEKNHIDYCLRAYILERFFNISFIYDLATFIDDKFRDNIENASVALIELINLASIPMAFSRNRYINIIGNTHFDNKYIGFAINYLNGFVLPVLQSVFYYLLILIEKKCALENKRVMALDTIELLLNEYIETNVEKYPCKYIISNIDNLGELKLSEELQINITRLVYNIDNAVSSIAKGESIEDFVEKLRSDSLASYYLPKYDFLKYSHKFPSNAIYVDYLRSEQEKKKKKKEKLRKK